MSELPAPEVRATAKWGKVFQLHTPHNAPAFASPATYPANRKWQQPEVSRTSPAPSEALRKINPTEETGSAAHGFRVATIPPWRTRSWRPLAPAFAWSRGPAQS